jgi:hypothetical protein
VEFVKMCRRHVKMTPSLGRRHGTAFADGEGAALLSLQERDQPAAAHRLKR